MIDREYIEAARRRQIEEGDVMKCTRCGKTISWDEYAVNWELCEECLDKDYGEYLRTVGEKKDDGRTQDCPHERGQEPFD